MAETGHHKSFTLIVFASDMHNDCSTNHCPMTRRNQKKAREKTMLSDRQICATVLKLSQSMRLKYQRTGDGVGLPNGLMIMYNIRATSVVQLSICYTVL